jgi:GDPmannose 4,6-dehydratase
MSDSDSGVLIVGSEGQDGQVLNRILSSQGKKVYKQSRQVIVSPKGVNFGIPTQQSLTHLFQTDDIGEIYFLPAIHSPAIVSEDFEMELEIRKHIQLLEDSMLRILEIVRVVSPKTRFFFASSALVFGDTKTWPQEESTTSQPTEIYGLFKKISQEIVSYYRDNLGLFSISGILYPHESEFRNERFLFRKIIDSAIISTRDPNHRLEIVDMDYTREWNCAYQVMECAIRALRIDLPSDYVIGSGKQATVREICGHSFEALGLNHDDFVVDSPAKLVKRSSKLLANPSKLFHAIGQQPDGEVKPLIERTIKRMREGLVV